MLDEVHKDYQDPFTSEFSKGNYGEIRLGTTTQTMLYPDYNIGEYDFGSVFFKYMGPNDLQNEAGTGNEYNLKTIQFGFFNANGYGYQSKTNRFGIYLYTGSGIHWSDVSYTGGDRKSDAPLNTYAGSLRFGQTWESGIRIPVLGPLAFMGAYETSIIFPRHLFWKWAVSGIIEGVAIGGLGEFSKWIMSKSPVAGPIVNWVLKTGAYYALYELRKTNMNWPYETAPPLTINSWKAGISLEF